MKQSSVEQAAWSKLRHYWIVQPFEHPCHVHFRSEESNTFGTTRYYCYIFMAFGLLSLRFIACQKQARVRTNGLAGRLATHLSTTIIDLLVQRRHWGTYFKFHAERPESSATENEAKTICSTTSVSRLEAPSLSLVSLTCCKLATTPMPLGQIRSVARVYFSLVLL